MRVTLASSVFSHLSPGFGNSESASTLGSHPEWQPGGKFTKLHRIEGWAPRLCAKLVEANVLVVDPDGGHDIEGQSQGAAAFFDGDGGGTAIAHSFEK
jgi:hypothetical protein